MSKKTVKQVFTWYDLLIIAIFVIAGIGIMAFGIDWIALGICVIACTVAFAPFIRHGYKLEGHQGQFRLEEFLVPRESQVAIMAYLNGETSQLEVPPSNQGGALVRIFQHRSDGLIMAQYFDYALFLKGTEFPMVRISTEQLESIRGLRSQN